MKPIGLLIRQTICDLDLEKNEREAKILMNSFWNEFKSRMTTLDERTIFLRNVGTFPLSRYKLGKVILKLVKSIRKKESKQLDATPERDKLKIALLRRNELAWKYFNIRLKRLENALKRLDNRGKERIEEWR